MIGLEHRVANTRAKRCNASKAPRCFSTVRLCRGHATTHELQQGSLLRVRLLCEQAHKVITLPAGGQLVIEPTISPLASASQACCVHAAGQLSTG